MHVKKLFAATVLLGAVAYGLNWDNALIMGTTPDEGTLARGYVFRRLGASGG